MVLGFRGLVRVFFLHRGRRRFYGEKEDPRAFLHTASSTSNSRRVYALTTRTCQATLPGFRV